jgi:hypothetical protein
MKEEAIRKIVQKSELKTSFQFTENLIQKIEFQKSKSLSVSFWSLKQIIIGFTLFVIVSGCLLFMLKRFTGEPSPVIIPFFWALFLLLGLNHLLLIFKNGQQQLGIDNQNRR